MVERAMVGTLRWPQSNGRSRRGDQRGASPMFFDAHGRRTWGFSAEALWSATRDSGKTYRELAGETGIAWRTVQMMARGSRQPSEPDVVALARALGIEPWQLCWA